VHLTKNQFLTASVLHVVMGAALATGSAIPLANIAFAATPGASNGANPAAVARGQQTNMPAAPGRQTPQAPQTPLRLAACNPCGAKKRGCGACNPCAAKKKGCGACNPCAAKKACSPCNPCGAKKACNPCNPCGGAGASASLKCAIPRLITAAACNPCAAKKKGCGACNPCVAKKACSPCNPCAAKKIVCGACNPCGGGAVAELTAAEARTAYDCLVKDLVAGYVKSGLAVASHYKDWNVFSNQPYVSDTHGGRYVNNYGNALAASYDKYEKAGRMPVGALLAKDSFAAQGNGKVAAGPLFLMEKMAAGFNKDSGNWRYTMVLPNGQVFGTTNGAGSAKMKFCYECHMSVAEEQDSLMFLPDEYRAR